MDCIQLWEFVYITYILCISLNTIFITVILAVWIEASSGSAPLLVIFVNTAVKPTFFSMLFHLSFFGIFKIFLCHKKICFFLSLLVDNSPSEQNYVVFLTVLLLAWLLLHFLHSFCLPRHPGCLEILYMCCCFLIYIRISVVVYSYLQ